MPTLPLQFQDQTIAFTFWAEAFTRDELVVTAFAVDEAIFGMTRIEVMLSSKDCNIDLQALMDKSATLTIHHKYLTALRHFSGIVVEAERGDSGHHRTTYRLVLMPSLYRLDHGSDCRIFQQKTVQDIVNELFSEHGIDDVTWKLTADKHFLREFCTQYRETHLAFVERILAEEGIFYHFTHDREGKHTLVLSDVPQVLPDCPGQKELEYNAMASGAAPDEFYCSSLNFRKKLRSTSYVQRDYSFRNPAYTQQHRAETNVLNGEQRDYQFYNYPGRYKKDASGKPFTQYRLDATRVDASLAYGISNTPLLLTGHGVKLTDHPDKELNQQWRLLTIRHEGVQPQAFGEDGQGTASDSTALVATGLAGTALAGLSFGTSSSQSPGVLHDVFSRGLRMAMQQAKSEDGNIQDACLYANAFAAQSFMLPYRPPQSAKPLVDGPQIAIVVGPPDEEIYTDEYGRVKVHFPWDRHNAATAENSSCWIRVSQAWGGGSFGNVAIPRVGHEVIVGFLEGDPDQPIIIGRTYHETNKTPYQLPDHKTKMAIRSETHKGPRGEYGFNELSFEDEKGQENMFLHAEKDQTIKIKNNQTQRIDANASQSIGANQAIEVGNNVNHQVGGGMNMVIGAVGGAAAGLTGGALAPMMEKSAKMLQESIDIAMQAMSQAASEEDAEIVIQDQDTPENAVADTSPKNMALHSLVQDTAENAVINTAVPALALPEQTGSALEDISAFASPALARPEQTGSALEDISAFAGVASQFANLVGAGGVMSTLRGMASAFDAARQGTNEAQQRDLRSEGGKSMAGATAQIAGNVGSLVGGGVFNQTVSRFQNLSTGIAVSEQIGSMKVSSIGHTSMENIGHTKQVDVGDTHQNTVGSVKIANVGEEYTINVGKSFTINVGGDKNGPAASIKLTDEGKIIITARDSILLNAVGQIINLAGHIHLNTSEA